jgi:hypothetical protein
MEANQQELISALSPAHALVGIIKQSQAIQQQ